MGFEEEGGDHTEVPPAAPNGPEQILVFAFAGRNESPVCQHNVGFEQVVYGQAVLAGKVAVAAA